MHKIKIHSLIIILSLTLCGFGIEYSYAYVRTDPTGRFYVKSEPRVNRPHSTIGVTKIFLAHEFTDREIVHFDWYSEYVELLPKADSLYLVNHGDPVYSFAPRHYGVRPNQPGPVITAFKDGRYYSKAISRFGKTNSAIGSTSLYEVKTYRDRELVRYNWYCPMVYLFLINDSLYTVRLNQWFDGSSANYTDITLGFYSKQNKLQEYSTLALSRTPFNIARDRNSYAVVAAYPDLVLYEMEGDGKALFSIRTTDSRNLDFDIRTGTLIK